MGVLKTCAIPGVLMLIFLQEHFVVVSSQECDTSSDATQCSEEERCKNNSCIDAFPCDSDAKCGDPAELCVADYCQPQYCTKTGQCVHGQICSHDTTPSCVYPRNLNVEENTEFPLTFSEPGAVGSYTEITWYKKSKIPNNKIVLFNEVLDEDPVYYGDYCSGSAPNGCNTSDKGELNLDTGDFTIKEVNLTDDDYYYYRFYIPSGKADTGPKYEIKLEVYVKPTEVSIEGISDEIVAVGTKLYLTCIVNRIKPLATEMYWMVSGVRVNGLITTQSNSDGTFGQTNELEYTVAKEDEGKPIICIVVPVYGDQVEVDQIVNPGYAPSGEPNLQPPSTEKHADEDVVLTCNKPDDDGDGNPPCGTYIWKKVEGNGGTTQKKDTWKFQMNQSFAGNYTCTCKNDYDESQASNRVEVIFLAGPAPASGGVSTALIGGIVGGVVFVILIVVIAIFIIRRRRKPSKGKKPDDETGLSPQSNGRVDQGPIYAQPDKSRKLRPQRGLDNGPEYANANALKGENPYENTAIDNNNPPDGKQENGGPDGVVYTEVNIRNGDKPEKPGKGAKPEKPGKPKAKERTSLKKPKVHQAEEPTVYAEITPVAKKDEQK